MEVVLSQIGQVVLIPSQLEVVVHQVLLEVIHRHQVPLPLIQRDQVLLLPVLELPKSTSRS